MTPAPFSIPARSIDDARPIKVIVIGAGISGVLASILLPQRIKNLDLTIYDKNPDLGGTWYENRYPGCACDIPAHSYQLSFESNPAWSTFYASSKEIWEYWNVVAEKYNSRRFMKFRHKCIEARWDENRAKWDVTFEKGGDGRVEGVKGAETVIDEADVLITGIGTLNRWTWPDIPGLHDFKGKLLHSAEWDQSFDAKDKKVAVIGAGSSGIQIVPALQPHVAHMDHYVRGKTWIAATFGQDEVRAMNNGRDGNFAYDPARIQAWLSDPSSYVAYRKHVEAGIQGGFGVVVKGSKEQADVRVEFTKLMQNKLKDKPEIAEHLIPSFPPLCKRLTPGPGYLEALTMENVNVIPTGIERIDADGVIGKDGQHRPVDAIVCATGFDTSHRNRFAIYGAGGVRLSEKWAEYPSSYLSMGVDGFPNFFMSLGPNSALGNGNLLMLIECAVGYITRCIAKMQTEDIRTMSPTPAAVHNFTSFCDAYFQGTVYSEECSSWYKSIPASAVTSSDPTIKNRGRVSALWPGSSLHAIQAMARPRWEDWTFEYIGGNPWAWFGDGWAGADRSGDPVAQTSYLDGVAARFVVDPLESNGVVNRVNEKENVAEVNGNPKFDSVQEEEKEFGLDTGAKSSAIHLEHGALNENGVVV